MPRISEPSPTRRAAVAMLTACFGAAAAPTPQLTVYKTPWCGCCSGWVDHMRASGFAAIRIVEQEDLAPVRRRFGIPDRYASCHTGVVSGYALEGHVPASDVRKLLAQRPNAAGLAVPGMPLGSPGMEAGDRKEPFETMLVLKDGTSRVFTRHA